MNQKILLFWQLFCTFESFSSHYCSFGNGLMQEICLLFRSSELTDAHGLWRIALSFVRSLVVQRSASKEKEIDHLKTWIWLNLNIKRPSLAVVYLLLEQANKSTSHHQTHQTNTNSFFFFFLSFFKQNILTTNSYFSSYLFGLVWNKEKNLIIFIFNKSILLLYCPPYKCFERRLLISILTSFLDSWLSLSLSLSHVPYFCGKQTNKSVSIRSNSKYNSVINCFLRLCGCCMHLSKK